MSWSISATGPKEECLKTIHDQASASPYRPGTLEGDDIVAAVARIEALVAALAPSATVELSAYGSHALTDGGCITSGSFSVRVSNAG